ncbi:MAG TPA: hypothetical protein VFO38_05240 [Candidatus Saccharimonadales bacterium]|nr:hypothetical protein [Candidatus Saccharimonadales bacterium]
MEKSQRSKVNELSPVNKLIALGVALVVLGVGIWVIRSGAAGFLFAAEAEQGAANGAVVLNDPTASAGKALQFKAPVTPPPTPPPTTGQQSCPPFPAIPDENCTGVPAGVALTDIKGSLTTTSNGQVIDGKNIDGDLVVRHDNVTVVNTRIKGKISGANGSPVTNRGFVMRDTELGPDTCASSGNGGIRQLQGGEFTLTRVHMHNHNDDMISLLGGGKIVIEDSLLNRGCYYPEDHLDAIQWYAPGDVANVTIKHSSIDSRPSNTSGYGNAPLFIADGMGKGSRFTITQNLFLGGTYSIRAHDVTADSFVDIDNNRVGRNQYLYGPCALSATTAFNGTGGVKFTNNAYSDGTPLPVSSC